LSKAAGISSGDRSKALDRASYQCSLLVASALRNWESHSDREESGRCLTIEGLEMLLKSREQAKKCGRVPGRANPRGIADPHLAVLLIFPYYFLIRKVWGTSYMATPAGVGAVCRKLLCLTHKTMEKPANLVDQYTVVHVCGTPISVSRAFAFTIKSRGRRSEDSRFQCLDLGVEINSFS
jgi:hypothetical protein